MPDKAIDLIDEAASRVRMYRSAAPPSLKEAMAGLQSLQRELEAAVSTQEFELAAELRDRERKLRERIDSPGARAARLQRRPTRSTSPKRTSLRSCRCGPASRFIRIAGEESERLLKMEEALHERIIGQEEAISTLSKAVRRARAGMKDPRRPIGSFIFLGPTGVGKTRAREGAGRVHVRLRGSPDQDRHVGVHGAPLRRAAWSVRLRAMSATKRAASSPKRCAASPTR